MPQCPIVKRAYKAKQEHERAKLTLVSCKSWPDYTPQTIQEKTELQGSD